MRRVQASGRALIKYLFTPTESAMPLAVLRISYCAILLYDIGVTFAHRQLLFDAVPYLNPSRFPVTQALVLWLLAAGALLIGFQTRAAALVNYLFSVLFIGFAAFRHGFEGHWDVIILHMGWVLLLMPVGRALSVDAMLTSAQHLIPTPSTQRVARIHEIIIILVLAVLYLDSCAYKLASPMYLRGLGLWAPASLPYNLHAFSVSLLDNRAASMVMGYFALCFELAFIVLAFIRSIRIPLVITGIVFHVTILVFFPIWSFSLMMVALYLGLLPGHVYERLLNCYRRPRTELPATLGVCDREAASPMERTGRLVISTVAAGLLFWAVSLVILLFASPLPGKLLPLSDRAAERLRSLAQTYKKIVYPWTGFSTHGVFVDGHFKDYFSQVRLVYKAHGRSLQLPIVDTDGTCIGYNTGRVWGLWAFRTVRPSLRLEHAANNLMRFIEYWANEEHIDLGRGQVEVLVRPVRVSLDRWQPGLLKRNLEGPWTKIGSASRVKNLVELRWEYEGPTNDRLGDLILRALPPSQRAELKR